MPRPHQNGLLTDVVRPPVDLLRELDSVGLKTFTGDLERKERGVSRSIKYSPYMIDQIGGGVANPKNHPLTSMIYSGPSSIGLFVRDDNGAFESALAG